MPAAAQPSDEVQALLDAAVDGVVLVDHLGCIQSFSRSAEQLFGYRAQEVLGRNVGVLMTDQDRSAHDGFLARYVSTRVRTSSARAGKSAPAGRMAASLPHFSRSAWCATPSRRAS